MAPMMSLDAAREVLTSIANAARGIGDPLHVPSVNEVAAAAINVVLESLSARARLLQAFDADLAVARGRAVDVVIVGPGAELDLEHDWRALPNSERARLQRLCCTECGALHSAPCEPTCTATVTTG